MSADYELVLMLDPEAPDERRDEITSGARKRIESGGTLKAEKAWGMRKLAYEIRQRNEADYRFFRFETESAVLDDLNHTLKITDGVLRFRIFKVEADSPVIEPPPPMSLAASSTGGGRGSRDRRPPRGPDSEADAEIPAAEAEPAPAAPEPAAAPEAAAEPAPEAPAAEAAAEPEAPAAEQAPAPEAEAPADAEPAPDAEPAAQ
jgi:ribosomal protein S6